MSQKDGGVTSSQARHLLVARLTSVPEGNFDAQHLVDIHRHLFIGMTSDAGELRVTERGYAGHDQVAPEHLSREVARFCGALKKYNFLETQSLSEATDTLANTFAGLLRLSPFDKGMEHAALVFTRGLAIQGGLDFDVRKMVGSMNTLGFAASQHLAGNKEMLRDEFASCLGQAEWVKDVERQRSPINVAPVLSERHGAVPNEVLRKKNLLLERRVLRTLEEMGADIQGAELKKVLKSISPDVDTLLPYPERLKERIRFEVRDMIKDAKQSSKYDNGVDFG